MKTPMGAPARFQQSLRAGVDEFQSLFARIQTISNETCHRLGEDIDGRDYAAMSKAIEASLRTVLSDANTLRREGYLRALTDLLCLAADGAGYTEDSPDPLTRTEAAFSGYA